MTKASEWIDRKMRAHVSHVSEDDALEALLPTVIAAAGEKARVNFRAAQAAFEKQVREEVERVARENPWKEPVRSFM